MLKKCSVFMIIAALAFSISGCFTIKRGNLDLADRDLKTGYYSSDPDDPVEQSLENPKLNDDINHLEKLRIRADQLKPDPNYRPYGDPSPPNKIQVLE